MEHIDRRSVALAILGGGAMAVAGCTAEQDKKPSLDEALSSLESAISSLQSEVSRFSDDNWREVVPFVQSGASNVAYAFSALKEAMGKKD